MSTAPALRRTDKGLAEARARELLERAKAAFFDALMRKYGAAGDGRPKGFYPRLAAVTVYAIAIERITGKETALPAPAERWPAADHTKSPGAVAP